MLFYKSEPKGRGKPSELKKFDFSQILTILILELQ